jgi:hypothetical protein
MVSYLELRLRAVNWYKTPRSLVDVQIEEDGVEHGRIKAEGEDERKAEGGRREVHLRGG